MTIEDSSPSKKQKNEYRDGDLIEEELINKTIYLNVFSLTDFSDATIEKFIQPLAGNIFSSVGGGMPGITIL